MINQLNRYTVRPGHILATLVMINLIIGILIAPDFGLSVDETHEMARSELARQLYLGIKTVTPGESFDYWKTSIFYGTGLSVLIRFIEPVKPPLNLANLFVIHYFYFVCFQAGAIGIYLLAKQFIGAWASLAAALLFCTQPLLFGHAFINPKDIPLLSIFLLAVVAGFRMVDRWTEGMADIPLSQQEQKYHQGRKGFFLTLGVMLFLLWFRVEITQIAQNFVAYAYNTKGESLIGKAFAALTSYGSLEGYQSLIGIHINSIYKWIYWGTLVTLIFLFIHTRNRQLFLFKGDLFVLGAALIWGLAISTRVIALAAGGIVGVYGVIQLRHKAIVPLMIYTATASIFSYLTWPFLWISGWRGLADSLILITDFPKDELEIFNGQFYLPNDLPASYVPTTLLLQLTEPLIFLALAGAGISIYLAFKKQTNRSKLILLFAWFMLPLSYTIFSHTARYNNFRQYLFILPPLFVFAGITLQQIFSHWKKPILTLGLCLIFMIPGLVSIVDLHPYQYIYYNSIVGGVSGAYRHYTLDYWRTSYKAVFDYANTILPPNSIIAMPKLLATGAIYARDDILVTNWEPGRTEHHPDYIIIPTYRNEDYKILPNVPPIYSVEVDGAVLALLKEVPEGFP